MNRMSTDSIRVITLFDGMTLIAATGTGLGLSRAAFAHYNLASWQSYKGAVIHLLLVILPQLVTWTFAYLAMRLRPPRPLFLQLRLQPGWVACLASSIVVLFILLDFTMMKSRAPAGWWPAPVYFLNYTPHVGFAVLGAWLTQAQSGCWEAEQRWIDRLGRTIGSTWIFAYILNWSRDRL
jgi:hypothetical protein